MAVVVERFETYVPDADVALAVRVHRAAGAGWERQPGVVVMGSWLTVKEQMADLYAGRLAERGYTAVTFDFAGFGASGGGLRQVEVPTRKIANLAAVVDHTRSLSLINGDRIGVLGVCASAQYALGALARGLPVAAFAAVAGWFHDVRTVAPFYGGDDGVRQRLERSSRAATRYAASGELSIVPAYGPGDDRAGMATELDYYADPQRGAIPAWRNEMSELSWSHWLTYDAFAAAAAVATAPAVGVPTLFVHSDDAVLPDNVRTVASQLGALAEMAWTEGAQTDFYDRPAQVDFAVDAVLGHFGAVMAP